MICDGEVSIVLLWGLLLALRRGAGYDGGRMKRRPPTAIDLVALAIVDLLLAYCFLFRS